MLEILQKIIGILTNDATLNAVVPSTNIYVGPVDIIIEKQSELPYPSIIVSVISEVVRTVPLNARDTTIQIDLFSRTSQLEIETAYERILSLLNYDSGDQNTAHLFWQRLGGAVDQFESDRRIWHRSMTFTCWSMKP